MLRLSAFQRLCFAVVLVLMSSSSAHAQNNASYKLTPRDADYIAAESADVKTHVMLANTDAANATKESGITIQGNHSAASRGRGAPEIPLSLYPADLTHQGGPVIASAEHHALFLHANGACATVAECWGDPESFLRDLGRSQFIHVTDQYVRANGEDRYNVGFNAHIALSMSGNMLSRGTILAILHSAGSATNATGYNHIYHLFLPPGVSTCLQAGVCYSPDNADTFAFCAYHGAVTFKDIGHIVYTVEPYQAVPGCHVALPSPNGQIADSTNSVLSHETFEAITDPDLNAWWNRSSLALQGSEIGDQCQPLYDKGFLVPTFKIGKNIYKVQLEYSNSAHRCVARANE